MRQPVIMISGKDPIREAGVGHTTYIRAHALASPRGFGSVRVEARIGDVTWRTSVFPLNSGGYILPVKADVRRRGGIAAGDEVRLKLELL